MQSTHSAKRSRPHAILNVPAHEAHRFASGVDTPDTSSAVQPFDVALEHIRVEGDVRECRGSQVWLASRELGRRRECVGDLLQMGDEG